MSQQENETKVNDLLTSFILHYKHIFNTKLTLLQSTLSKNNTIHNNIQFLISKLSTKKYEGQWPIDPYSIIIKEDNLITIQRFILRIQQFLQYRLNNLNSLQEKIINKQIQNLQKNTNKIIKILQFNKSNNNSQINNLTFGKLFYQILKIQKQFINKIFEVVMNKSNNCIKKSLLDIQNHGQLREFLFNRIEKEEFSKYRQSEVEENQENGLIVNHKQTVFATRMKSLETPKLKTVFKIKKYPQTSKNIIQLSNFQSLQQNRLINNKNPDLYSIHWKAKPQNPTIAQLQAQDLQRCLQRQKKQRIIKIYDILDIDQGIDNKRNDHNNDIFGQLRLKNTKNWLMIEAFLKRYQKKKRRSEKRQHVENTCKSTGKAMRKNSTNEQLNTMIQIKTQINSSNNSINKKINEFSIRRNDEIQLPRIASGGNRRTTMQK